MRRRGLEWMCKPQDLDHEGVIYAIAQTGTRQLYVGQSINSAYTRFKQHFWKRISQQTPLQKAMARSRDVRSEFFVVPLQKVPLEDWGEVRPREKQVESFRRVANALEQQWIADLSSTWNVTRWYGTTTLKQGRRNRRQYKPPTEKVELEATQQTQEKPKWVYEQKAFCKMKSEQIEVSVQPGPQRNVRRKVAFLLNWMHVKAPGNLDLAKWKTPTVQKCLHWLQAVVTARDKTSVVQELEQLLCERLRTKRTRLTHQKNDKVKGGLLRFIKVFHTNRLINLTRLRQVLHDESVTGLHPDPETANSLQVCDKLATPILRVLGNFTQVAYSLHSLNPGNKEGCEGCNFLSKATDVRWVDNHCVALDPNFIPDPQIREWVSRGAKFRLDRDPRGVLVAIKEGLNQYIEIYVKATKATTEEVLALERWKDKILAMADTNLARETDDEGEKRKEKSLGQVMKHLQENVVVVPVDKAGHNLGFVCKTWYVQKLKEELSNERGAYRTSPETVDEVLGRHAGFNQKFGFEHVEAFPYLYGILKAHKNPVQLRFIAGCSKKGGTIQKRKEKAEDEESQLQESEEDFIRRMTRERNSKPRSSLTEASKEAVKILRALIDTLREREEKEYKTTGVRKWWTVESIEEVALNIKDSEHKLIGKRMRTADFTTMYTKLPHQKVIEAMEVAWGRAVEHKMKESNIQSAMEDWGLALTPEGSYVFQTRDMDDKKQWGVTTKPIFMELMKVLITDNHIWNGEELKRQVVGIPMGSPVSPHLANLFRYVVEAKFVESLVTNGKLCEAKACEHTFAYIDDLCTFEGPLPTEEHYGIPMTGDKEPKETVNFLGMRITTTNPNRSPRLGIVEKQEEWDFNVIKYPHAGSNIPWNQGAAVFKGQLIRYAIICNNLWDFQTASLRLAGRLVQRGHEPRLLISTWTRYLNERWPQNLAHKYKMQRWFPLALSNLRATMPTTSPHTPAQVTCSFPRRGKKWVPKPDQQKEASKGEKEAKADKYQSTNHLYREIPRTKNQMPSPFQETFQEIDVDALEQQQDAEQNNDTIDREELQTSSTLQDLVDLATGLVAEGNKSPTLPIDTRIVSQKGDGNCLFHGMAYILRTKGSRNITGTELRHQTVQFVLRNPDFSFQGKKVCQWVQELEGQNVSINSYVEHLRRGMYGGTLEIQIVAWLHKAQFRVFVEHLHTYKCIFTTEPESSLQGNLLFRGKEMAAHYDVLDSGEALTTEPEVEATQDDGIRAPKKKKVVLRSKMSLQRTTTQYNDICGVCAEAHTRRRVSVKCVCGMFVHLSCMGYKSWREFSTQTQDEQVSQDKCKCMKSPSRGHQTNNAKRKIVRLKKIQASRASVDVKDSVAKFAFACLVVATTVAQEQNALRPGSYVRLHGLSNQDYNGKEGRIVSKNGPKAEVVLASTSKHIRTNCKNLSWMPTFKVSRCKLRPPQVVELVFQPTVRKVLPNRLTGTFYEYLGVNQDATQAEIKAAYKKLSIQLHPDKNQWAKEKATELFQQVVEAYECLTDATKRQAYDRQSGLTKFRSQKTPAFGRGSTTSKNPWV